MSLRTWLASASSINCSYCVCSFVNANDTSNSLLLRLKVSDTPICLIYRPINGTDISANKSVCLNRPFAVFVSLRRPAKSWCPARYLCDLLTCLYCTFCAQIKWNWAPSSPPESAPKNLTVSNRSTLCLSCKIIRGRGDLRFSSVNIGVRAPFFLGGGAVPSLPEIFFPHCPKNCYAMLTCKITLPDSPHPIIMYKNPGFRALYLATEWIPFFSFN